MTKSVMSVLQKSSAPEAKEAFLFSRRQRQTRQGRTRRYGFIRLGLRRRDQGDFYAGVVAGTIQRHALNRLERDLCVDSGGSIGFTFRTFVRMMLDLLPIGWHEPVRQRLHEGDERVLFCIRQAKIPDFARVHVVG